LAGRVIRTAVKAPPKAYVEVETGKAVNWLYDAQGSLLVKAPSDGVVFNKNGQQIQVRAEL
jgi:hypothetical protein